MNMRPRSRVLSSLSVIALAGALIVAVAPASPASAATVATTVTVDASADKGAFNNPAWYQNVSHLEPLNLAKINEIAPKVSRGWRVLKDHYDPTTGVLDLNNAGFDQQTQYSERMLYNLGQCDAQYMTISSPGTCTTILYKALKQDKARYPNLRYIELFNETELQSPAMSASEYYQWYKIAYGLVNQYNSAFDPAIPLRIGGPAAFEFDTGSDARDRIQAFLTNYAADTDPAKRLDFISFHEYGHGADPSAVQGEKGKIQGWLKTLGLDQSIPVFVTEYGVFPAPRQHETTPVADHVTQAAAMATLGMYFVQGNMDMPMQWEYVYDDANTTNPDTVKSMFVNNVDGSVYPYYNVVKMESMLKADLIGTTTTSPAPAGGIGVNTLATEDGTGMALLTSNYQWTTGTASSTVTLNVTNQQASNIGGKQFLVERYLVDATTSNYDANPATDDLTQVERYVEPAGTTQLKPYTLTPNAVSLVVLTPVTYAEAESLTPTISGDGALLYNIDDDVASGKKLALFQAQRAGDSVQYTIQAPADGYYRVEAPIKRTPTRGVVQPDIDGVAAGGPIDTYVNGYDWITGDLGVHHLTAGAHTVRFTLTAAGGGGDWSFGVDYFDLRTAYPDTVEAESRMPVSPSGDQVLILSESGASGGSYVKTGTNAVGDSVSYTIMVPHTGDFLMSARVKTTTSRGRCQFSKDGTDIGDPVDMYSATAAFTLKPGIGPIHLDGPGLATITCTVKDKNAASTGYDQALDYFQFQPID